jgi:hypothetical protein
MVHNVNVILKVAPDNPPVLQLDDDDYAKLQELYDSNIYGFEKKPFLRVKVDNKYKNFETYIFGLEKFSYLDHDDNNKQNYQRNNLIMCNSSLKPSRKKWSNETKKWELTRMRCRYDMFD